VCSSDLFLRPPERALLSIARNEWRSGMKPGPVEVTPQQREQHLHGVVYALDQIHEIYQREISDRRAQIEATHRRFLMLLTLVSGLGFAGALAGAVLLARSVLRPLREIERGVEHFTHDDLSYRLRFRSHDELGHLAEEFNTMAEHLLAQQQKLEKLSSRDGLTGLYNRREFERRLSVEFERARRYGRPFSVLMLDIDHFKLVNDDYGHQAGDEVLQTVSDLVRLNVRPADIVCRYGGEELVVILPETGEEGAMMVAERVRHTVAEAVITAPSGETIHVTVSIGVAGFPQDAAGAPELVGMADAALYAAKQHGRNRVHRQ
jgi:diguanylate cyclase (GGDEF)-like protein